MFSLFAKKAPVVPQSQLKEIVASSDWQIVDIRGEEKIKRSSIKTSKKYEDETKLEKNKKVLVVCNQGIGAAILAKKLKKQGVDAYVLEGGMGAVEDKSLVNEIGQ